MAALDYVGKANRYIKQVLSGKIKACPSLGSPASDSSETWSARRKKAAIFRTTSTGRKPTARVPSWNASPTSRATGRENTYTSRTGSAL